MNKADIISKNSFCKLDNAEGGHDWFHIERVYKNAMLISQMKFVINGFKSWEPYFTI
jgi:HD superfamily phosphodiesterase